MKVKLIRNPAARFGCKLHEGDTGTVDDVTGKALVDAGIAVEIPEPKEIEAIPDRPAIAEAKPEPIKAPVEPKPSDDPSVVESTGRLRDYVKKQKREPKQKES